MFWLAGALVCRGLQQSLIWMIQRCRRWGRLDMPLLAGISTCDMSDYEGRYWLEDGSGLSPWIIEKR